MSVERLQDSVGEAIEEIRRHDCVDNATWRVTELAKVLEKEQNIPNLRTAKRR